jgi:hypothetical protein
LPHFPVLVDQFKYSKPPVGKHASLGTMVVKLFCALLLVAMDVGGAGGDEPQVKIPPGVASPEDISSLLHAFIDLNLGSCGGPPTPQRPSPPCEAVVEIGGLVETHLQAPLLRSGLGPCVPLL